MQLTSVPLGCVIRLTSLSRGYILETAASTQERIRLTGNHLIFVQKEGKEALVRVDHVHISDLLLRNDSVPVKVIGISRETEEQQYFALDCPPSSNLIAYVNGIKTYTEPIARRAERDAASCVPPLHPYCPPTDFLNVIVLGSMASPEERLCWELLSDVSPYKSLSAWFNGNISQWQNITGQLVSASVSGTPWLYQSAQFQKRENLFTSWTSFLALDSRLSQLKSSTDCLNARGCVEYVGYLQSGARTSISFMRPDLIVTPICAALSVTIYGLLLFYVCGVAVLAWLYFQSLAAAKMKYYTIIMAGISLVIVLRIIWWSFMWAGMGPQYTVPSLAGRVVFRIGTILFFWCIALFLSLWLRVCFATFYESPLLLRLSTGVLAVVTVAGTVAAIVMGVLTEYSSDSIDVSMVLLSFLEFVMCCLTLALTGMTLFKLAKENANSFAKQRKGLITLIVVEIVLVCAFIIQLVVSFYVLFVPPLSMQDWISYFAGVTIPDLLAFGAIITLLAINYRTARKRSVVINLGTRSTSVTGTTDSSAVEMRIPERYQE